jgi:hypothetical protein
VCTYVKSSYQMSIFLTIILKYPICGVDCGKSVGHMNKVQSVFGVRWLPRVVNQNFSIGSHGERLGESHTWCTTLCEIKLYNSLNWFCEVLNMSTKSWNCSQHVVKLVVYGVHFCEFILPKSKY